MSHHDVIVVGAGVAGLTAATRLADQGARVLVLARGVGATHLTGGTIDVFGYGPERVTRPAQRLARLIQEQPEHPYARVGIDAIADALDFFKAAIADGPLAPYAYAGGLEENRMLPTAVGAVKPSALVPQTMAAGDLRAGDRRLCIIGFRALKDFHAPLLADNLNRSEFGARARAFELDLVSEGRVDVNSQGFARAFDEPAFRALVCAEVAGRLRPGERVGFPAVLGLRDPHAVWRELEHRLGRPVFEVPTLPPSVPGMRIWASLRDRLRGTATRIIHNAVVTGATTAGTRVTALEARVGLREAGHGADWVVLATGGFASRGLELDSSWQARETALGLPVSGMPDPGEDRFLPGYFEPQPLAGAGVATDAGLRPCDPSGRRLLDNVLVAGATLAGAQPWREKSGDGISITTGHRAAEAILEEAGVRDRPATEATAGARS